MYSITPNKYTHYLQYLYYRLSDPYITNGELYRVEFEIGYYELLHEEEEK